MNFHKAEAGPSPRGPTEILASLLRKPRLPLPGKPEKVTENEWEKNCFTNRKLVLVLKSRSRQFLRQNIYYLLK